MLRRIVINSKSSGKFREQTINGREHIVTDMVSIAMPSVMNRILYPEAEVRAAYNQLDRVPAPASHPQVDGLFISANDPVAVNAHNVGAFALNPRIENGQVVNDLAIDVAVAEKDERGVEMMRRVRNGEQMGVSTGLNGTLVLAKGEFNGRDYDGIISGIEFDHVAVLLEEAPAGETTYTLNTSGDDDVIVCNLEQTVNELQTQLQEVVRERYQNVTRADGERVYTWVVDVKLDPNSVIVDVNDSLQQIPFEFDANNKPVLTGVGTKVQRVVTFEANAQKAPGHNTDEGKEMDKEKIVLAIIANGANSLSITDKDHLMSLDEGALMLAVFNAAVHPEHTVDDARELCTANGLAVNTAEDVDGLEDFQTHKAAFNAWQAEQATVRKAKADDLIANSDFEQSDVDAMSDEQLDRAVSSIIPNNDYSAQGAGRAPGSRGGDAPAVNFSFSV